jgi:acetylglutamate synthase
MQIVQTQETPEEKPRKRILAELTSHEWHLLWLEIMNLLRADFKATKDRAAFERRFKNALQWFRVAGPKISYAGMIYSTI